jgi:hypothetical protein
LLEEIDDVIMEGWAYDFTLGETIDSMPNYLREAFLRLNLSTPVKGDDGSYTITLRI